MLSGNALGDEGVIAICEALRQRQGANLKTLELAKVSISPEAMGAISDLVGACSTLETLNLSMNEWGDGGGLQAGDGARGCQESSQPRLLGGLAGVSGSHGAGIGTEGS